VSLRRIGGVGGGPERHRGVYRFLPPNEGHSIEGHSIEEARVAKAL
jgi:hypothetical protein